ncbi:hypothetical protein BJX65DRAFT_320069 [Aspergillus insuetus]
MYPACLQQITNRLEGKTIVITGASSGLGKIIAKELARTSPGNLNLVLTARRIDNLRDVAAQIQQEADVDQPAEIVKFDPSLPDEFKDADILVNNAGLVRGMAQTPDIESEDMAVIFDTNVTGLINMTQAILPIYKTRSDGGRGDIISIGSIADREPYQGGSIYCATKAAFHSFAVALCKGLIATRIYVIEIDPGQVETRFYGDKAKANGVYRLGVEPLTGDAIAEVVVFAAGLRENVVIADTLVYSQPSGCRGFLICNSRSSL